jgi:hypothetical protein
MKITGSVLFYEERTSLTPYTSGIFIFNSKASDVEHREEENLRRREGGLYTL